MTISPLTILALFLTAKRLHLGLSVEIAAEWSGASPAALKRAERKWHVLTSKDLLALIQWTGLTGTPTALALMDGLNRKLAENLNRTKETV